MNRKIGLVDAFRFILVSLCLSLSTFSIVYHHAWSSEGCLKDCVGSECRQSDAFVLYRCCNGQLYWCQTIWHSTQFGYFCSSTAYGSGQTVKSCNEYGSPNTNGLVIPMHCNQSGCYLSGGYSLMRKNCNPGPDTGVCP